MSRKSRRLKKILLMPDLHAPYHSEEAFGCFLNVAEGWEPDTFVCLGDFGDCNAISTHPKDPKKLQPFQQELAGIRAARARLDWALRNAGCKDKRMLQGNHDTRIDRYINANAPEMSGMVDWTDSAAYDLVRNRWKVTPYKESLQIGHLRLTHDVGRAGVNAARQSLLDVGESIAFGHTHRGQVVYQGTVTGRKLVGATIGWLGDPEAIDYRHRDSIRRDSIHGFATVYMQEDGLFWLNFVPIIEGRCVVDGVLYTA